MMTMLRTMLTAAIALIAVATALAPVPAAAQSGEQQYQSDEAFYSKGTGGVPPN
jgi:hypothetical protein